MHAHSEHGYGSGHVMAAAAAGSALAFGAVDQLWFAPAQFMVFLLASAILWREGLPRLTTGMRILAASLVLVPLIQLVPLPNGLVETVSAPRSLLASALRGAGVPESSFSSLSIYPFATWSALLRLACYLLVFILAVRNYQLHRRQPGLIGLLIGLGLFEACYGIVQYTTGFPYIFLFQKQSLAQEATGTYINRNHYAGLLEMALPFLAARMLSHAGGQTAGGFLRRILVAPRASGFLRDALLFVITFLGLMFSLSRAGTVAGLIGLCVAALLMARHRRRPVLTILLFVVLFVGGYAAWIGLAPAMERFEGIGLVISDAEVRLSIWRDTLQLIRDSPWLGTGLGTFEWASLHYQSALPGYRYEHAHNDPLETAADLGIPLAAGLWLGLGALLFRLVRKAAEFNHRPDRLLAAGCAGAMTAIFLHSLFDFNLQIPANALIFSWIAGTAAALIQRSRPQHRRPGLNRHIIEVTGED